MPPIERNLLFLLAATLPIGCGDDQDSSNPFATQTATAGSTMGSSTMTGSTTTTGEDAGASTGSDESDGTTEPNGSEASTSTSATTAATTGDPSGSTSGSSTTGAAPDLMDACEAVAPKIVECYPNYGYTAESWAEACVTYTSMYDEDCQTAYVAWYSCISELECKAFGDFTGCETETEAVDSTCFMEALPPLRRLSRR